MSQTSAASVVDAAADTEACPDSSTGSSRRSPLNRPGVRFLLQVQLSCFWALICNTVLEITQTGANFGRFFSWTLDETALLFLLNGTVVWTLVVLLWAVTGRLWVALASSLSISVVIGSANYQKISLRLEPIYPSDLSFAGNVGFLSDMVSATTVVAVVLIVFLVSLVIGLSTRILRRTLATTGSISSRSKGLARAGRVVAIVLSVCFLAYAAGFNQPHNRLRGLYEASGAHWKFWYQKLNYQSNGFVAGTLYNLPTPAMETPPGYGEEAMAGIVSRYATAADRLNEGRAAGALDDVNVVMVLSEAFTDPSEVGGVEYAEDPIPFVRSVMGKTTSGTMLAQLFGGGTANMEFEALTGMSMSQFEPQMNTPYQMLVPDYRDFPSAVGWFKGTGHDAIAVHPYMTSMYKREKVYPVLGFQDFVAEADMPGAQRIDKSEFISDESAFAEVLRQLDRHERPTFVNLVTMQNHYPMADLYDDPLPVTGISGEPKTEAEGYGRGLAHTDQALRRLLGQLSASKEKTAVVFYGDHQPAFWPEKVRDANGTLKMQSTPFFIWANFPLEEQDTGAVTSPIFFLPMLFRAAGQQLPPYYALLTELQTRLAAMEQDVYLDPSGEQVDEADLDPEARQLLEDFRMVQYDLSVGERYSAPAMFPQQH